MQEEIKEILDKLRKLEYDDYELEYDIDQIERKEEKLLLDYITDLQEEKNDLLDMCSRKIDEVSNLQKELNGYKQERENLFASIERIQKENSNLLNTNYCLNSRNEKAIKYINEMCLCSDGYANYGDDLRPEHIVDILQGVDKE